MVGLGVVGLGVGPEESVGMLSVTDWQWAQELLSGLFAPTFLGGNVPQRCDRTGVSRANRPLVRARSITSPNPSMIGNSCSGLRGTATPTPAGAMAHSAARRVLRTWGTVHVTTAGVRGATRARASHCAASTRYTHHVAKVTIADGRFSGK